MVVDAMTGQDAVNVAAAFAEKVDFDGVIMSKLDGDARGGAALSIRQVTGKPIKFASFGEKTDALEAFHPDRMAKRILGMGDVISLIEKAQEVGAAEMDAGGGGTTAQGRVHARRLPRTDQAGPQDGRARLDHEVAAGRGQAQGSRWPGRRGRARPDRGDHLLDDHRRARRSRSIINGSRRERIAEVPASRSTTSTSCSSSSHETRKLMKQFQGMSGKGKRRMKFPGLPGGF